MVAKYRCNWYEMHCEGKLKLRSHNTSYCLIEVVTKAGLTVHVLWKNFSSETSYNWANFNTNWSTYGYMNWRHYEETVKNSFSQKQVNYAIYPFMKRKFIYWSSTIPPLFYLFIYFCCCNFPFLHTIQTLQFIYTTRHYTHCIDIFLI